MTPEQRYVYLTWLQDVSQDIDVGYKFLFFYGLERQLLIGNTSKAFDMIVSLRKNTNNGSFQGHSGTTLYYFCIRAAEEDALDRLRFLFEDDIWSYLQNVSSTG